MDSEIIEKKKKGFGASLERQRKILSFLTNEIKYKVEPASGMIYSWRSLKNEWVEMRLQTAGQRKYKQVLLWSGRGNKESIHAYLHVCVWLVANGTYDENAGIRFRDGDVTNCKISNLILSTDPDSKAPQCKPRDFVKKVRHKEYCQIVKLLKDEPGISAKEISDRIRCTYQSVKYAVRAIKNGVDLKYSKPGPYTSPNSKVAKWIKNMNNADYHIHPEEY